MLLLDFYSTKTLLIELVEAFGKNYLKSFKYNMKVFAKNSNFISTVGLKNSNSYFLYRLKSSNASSSPPSVFVARNSKLFQRL